MENTFTNDRPSDVPRILEEIRQKMEAITCVDLVYPMGNNLVRAVSKDVELSLFLPSDSPNCSALETFYELCDGINLPDVGNGIFIHGRELVATNAKRGLPIALREGGSILVFGSDGGGGMFVMPTEARSDVIHLSVGAVLNGEYDNVRYPTAVVARNFTEFLVRVAADMNAFIAGRSDWRFIV